MENQKYKVISSINGKDVIVVKGTKEYCQGFKDCLELQIGSFAKSLTDTTKWYRIERDLKGE